MNKGPLNIINALQAIAPVKKTEKLLIAISGGVDSVVLAFLCQEAGYPIVLAHCNFKLRGEESDRDEALVKKLAAQWGVQLQVRQFDTDIYARQHKISIQEAARNLRYEWFHQLQKEDTTLKWILTAHHKDDNIETVAMNFFRGTGLAGLTGIPARNGNICRPLLSISKEQILEFATKNQLPFAEDSSNWKEDYTRNYFRHTILPAVEKVYPEVKNNLQETIERFKSIEELYRSSVNKILRKVLIPKGDELHFSVGQLRIYRSSSLLYEILHPYGFSPGQIEEAWYLTEAKSGAQIQAAHQPWRLIRHRNWMILAPTKAEKSAYTLIDADTQEVNFEMGVLKIEQLPTVGKNFPASNDHVWLDAKKIEFPLLLRLWKEGDYFYPLGMNRKKKVSRFLIDLKKSSTEKEKIWVLESAGRICWVVGQRIDERYKIKPSTKQVVSLHFIPSK